MATFEMVVRAARISYSKAMELNNVRSIAMSTFNSPLKGALLLLSLLYIIMRWRLLGYAKRQSVCVCVSFTKLPNEEMMKKMIVQKLAGGCLTRLKESCARIKWQSTTKQMCSLFSSIPLRSVCESCFFVPVFFLEERGR